MFGGQNSSQTDLADTWVYNGTNWTMESPTTNPPARYAAGMAYDSVNQETVLFGGNIKSTTYYGDTWVWNGTNWLAQSPAASPAARGYLEMVYDSTRQETLLFGGNAFTDTWTWNPTNWSEAAPPSAPPQRLAHGMAYDAARQQVVLFGGAPASGQTFFGDTWVWNGASWTQKLPLTSPSPRYCIALAYDAATGQTILFGGVSPSGQVLSDTWAWDGTNWTEFATAGPPARGCYGMAFDSLHQQVVLFGGEDSVADPIVQTSGNNPLGDTWVWNGTSWTQVFPALSPQPRYGFAMVYDSTHQNTVLFGGVIAAT
jgi:hypothetical protein